MNVQGWRAHFLFDPCEEPADEHECLPWRQYMMSDSIRSPAPNRQASTLASST